MVSKLELLLNRVELVQGFIGSNLILQYGAAGERVATKFIDLCVEKASRGFPPAVVVAGELAKIEEEGNLKTSSPRRRAFLQSVPHYELVYEGLWREPSGDPTWGLKLDVLEAIFDHPLFRNAPFNAGRVFDRPPNLETPPPTDLAFTTNPFEAEAETEVKSKRRARERVRNDALVRFILLPLVIVAALVGVFVSTELPERQATLIRLACILIGGAAAFYLWFWDNLPNPFSG